MSRALYTAATGMHAQQLKIDVIANNLANINTDGYKQSRPEFKDLLYQNLRIAGGGLSQSSGSGSGLQVGLGVRPSATVRNFEQGNLRETSNPLTVAIDNEGFLQVRRPTGEIVYTRNGSLKVDERGRLATTEGYLLEPNITLPTDTNPDLMTISPDGTVTVRSTSDQRDIEVGRIRLVRLLNRDSLEALGSSFYRAGGDRRSLIEGYPSEEGFGSIQQGYVEVSNVKVVEEMVAMIAGQRAYEANSKVIQASDRMLEEANRLR
ncbi:MAG: flagellar basal-body rod protein FlgG [Myxococcales bacterium]|nr:flagellar basal-body rod protein FlgG [Myxococcales bacterium]